MSLSPNQVSAIEDFNRMRRRAGMQKVFDIFRKRSGLLSYEDVRRQLHAIERPNVELKNIEISAIKGSVGRYQDFTRDFLPTEKVSRQRWASVKAQFFGAEGVPPIEVYQIGEVYFVLDGNHRISVAKEMGSPIIEAYVRQVDTKVPLALDDDVDQLLIKTELADFLEQTHFDQLYPDVDLTVTAPGCYHFILQQIEAVHFARELHTKQSVSYDEGVKSWYETIYEPIIDTIRELDFLKDYPSRTETDLFLWIFKHRAKLAKSLGWEVSPKEATKNLSQQSSSKIKRYYERSKQVFLKFIRKEIDSGPPPGTWRAEKMAAPEGRLFANIITVIDGTEEGWSVFSQGVLIAGLEGSQLYGLYINYSGRVIPNEEIEAIQTEFGLRCESCDARGQLTFESGLPEEIIKERASWADLVIVSTQDKLKTDIQALAQSCPIPLLVTNGSKPEFEAILLAYDGSPKAEEALFLAAYLATFWELSLTVITILEKNHAHVTTETMVHAKEFLDYYGVPAQYLETDQGPVESILQAAQKYRSDLIVMGGYGKNNRPRSRKRVLDKVLKKSEQAILICR